MTATSALSPHATVMTVTAVAAGLHQKYEIAVFDLCIVELLMHPKMLAASILDAVASQLKLTEKQYFGLYFLDKQSHQRCWLLLDKQLAEQELPSSTAGTTSTGTRCIRLYFDVRFYTEGISYLRDGITIELFFHSARSAVCEGRVECNSEIAFDLAAQALQAAAGDHVTDELAMAHMKSMRLLCPATQQTEQLSTEYCEQRVLALYRGLRGQTRGECVACYMNTVEKQATYGIAYYEVTDAMGNPWCLGLSCHGLVVCNFSNKRSLHRVFLWKHLENLYFRDRKFTIEIYDPKRVTHILSSFNPYENAIQEAAEEFDDLSNALCEPTTQYSGSNRVSISRRTFGPKNTNVYAWFTADAKQARAIWTEAVCQHQFYQESRHHLVRQVRSMSEVAAQVPAAVPTLSSAEVTPLPLLLPPSGVRASATRAIPVGGGSQDAIKSSAPLPTVPGVDNFTEKQAKRRRKLSQRRDELRAAIKVALQELRDVCLQEAALTGSVPPEYPAAPGEQPPAVPRRVRTAFTITVVDGKPEVSREERAVKKLEVQYELQKQIAKATLRLVNDSSLPSVVRKKHNVAYERLCSQVNNLELELHRAVQRMATAGNADLSSLSSGFSEDVGADINEDIKSLSIHSSPLPSYHSNVVPAAATNHLSKVASSPQLLQQSLLDERIGSGSATPPPLMPRLSSSALTGGSSSGVSSSSHQRQRHLSGGAATDRFRNLAASQPLATKPTAMMLDGDSRGEQRSQSPAPILVPRWSATQPQKQPADGNPQRPPRLSVSASLTEGQMRGLQLSEQLQQQQRHQQRGQPAAAAAARVRPARSGSCDDLLVIEGSPVPGHGDGNGGGRCSRAREMLSTNNPYGSLERRRPRAVDRHGEVVPATAAPASFGVGGPAAQVPLLIADRLQTPPTSDTQPLPNQLCRVQSSPLPLQRSERQAAAAEQQQQQRRRQSEAAQGSSRRSNDAVTGPEPVHGAAHGRHTPTVFVMQPTVDLSSEPVPPLLPRTSRRLSSGTSSSHKGAANPPHPPPPPPPPPLAIAAAERHTQQPSPAPPSTAEQLYDAYAVKLSKASQRLYEMKSSTGAEPPATGPRQLARQNSNHAVADHVTSLAVTSIGSSGGVHRPLGRRSALPTTGSDVDFGGGGSGSSRSGSSRSSSPGPCNGIGSGSSHSVVRSHSQELVGPTVRQTADSVARAGMSSTGRPSGAGRLPPTAATGAHSTSSLGGAAAALPPPPASGRWVGYDRGFASNEDGIAGQGRPLLRQRQSGDGGHRGGGHVVGNDSSNLLQASFGSSQPRHEAMTLVYGRYQPPMASDGSREVHQPSAQHHGTPSTSAAVGSTGAIAYPRSNLTWHDQSFEPASVGPSESSTSSALPHVSTLV